MKKKVEIEIHNILNDKTSGSNDLLFRINELMLHNYSDKTALKFIIRKFQKAFPTFIGIQNYLFNLEETLRRKDPVEKFFQDFMTKEKIVYDSILKNVLPYLKKHKIILTISNSKTVLEILTRLNSKNKIFIFVCESRPNNEGRILAEKLASQKIKTQLITEAQTATYLGKSDCVLIGSDSILNNGDVVNKIGSLQLAILCKHFDKPFYVIADKLKFTSKKKFVQLEKSNKEIWGVSSRRIKIENFYFERIPKALITKTITN